MTPLRKCQLLARRYLFRVPSRIRARRYGIVAVPPCYHVRPLLHAESVVVDCGTGSDADFSMALMTRFGVRSIGFEPTRKHHPSLEGLMSLTNGRFQHRRQAVASGRGTIAFHESRENVSGSIMPDHVNVRSSPTVSYPVETLGIDDLFDALGVDRIDLLKLDIEGAEYEALAAASTGALRAIEQLLVEFHDHCIPSFSPRDTMRLVRRLEASGFQWHVTDGIDYLFFRA